MKNIYIHSISNKNDNIFDENVRDDSNRHFIILKEKLCKLGYNFTTIDNKNIDDADYIFFFDYPSVFYYSGLKGKLKYIFDFILKNKVKRNVYKECLNKGYKNKMILFLWEAKAVCSKNWEPSFHKLFNIIFTWNDKYIDNLKYFKVYCPQNPYKFKTIPDFKNKKLLVNISMNKRSSFINELYSERKRAIKFFENKIPNDFDLFGFGWNKPLTIREKLFPFLVHKFKSYKGTINNKLEILINYKFSLCFENISNQSGYITEKIFDCLKSGCIPIYLGASNIDEYIDSKLFIDKRNFKNYEDLYNYLDDYTEDEFQNFLINSKNYLESSNYELFSCDAFASKVIKILNL